MLCALWEFHIDCSSRTTYKIYKGVCRNTLYQISIETDTMYDTIYEHWTWCGCLFLALQHFQMCMNFIFIYVCGQEGSLKRRGRSHLVGWEIKHCRWLWREALKTLQLRSTFGSSMWKKWTLLPCEAHSEVKIIKTRQNTSLSEHLWCKADFEAKMLKKCGFRALWTVEMFTQSARGCGAKHISKSKWWKFCGFEAIWTVGTFRKCIAVVARSTFRSQNAENTSGSALLEVEPSISVAGAMDSAP